MDMIGLLILAAVAILVLARLYAVLGRDDTPPPMADPSHPSSMMPEPPVSANANAVVEPVQMPEFTGRDSLLAALPGFNPEEFLQGARAAYEMIVDAFARGDRDTLRELLEDEVFENYDEAIGKREMEKKILSIDIVRMDDPRIVEAEIENKQVFLTVEFHSDLAIAEYLDGDDETVPDMSTEPAETTEQWTFTRNIASRDPNWKLAAVAAMA